MVGPRLRRRQYQVRWWMVGWDYDGVGCVVGAFFGKSISQYLHTRPMRFKYPIAMEFDYLYNNDLRFEIVKREHV